jgi:uncharacterized membrane protein (UPF0127 family)
MPMGYYKRMNSSVKILLAGAVAACLVIIGILAYLALYSDHPTFEGSITSPEEGSTLDGPFSIEFEITEPENCTYQQLLIDDEALNNWTVLTLVPRPLSFSLYTALLSDGEHNIKMRWSWGMPDGFNATYEDSVSVNVQSTLAVVTFEVPGNYVSFACEIADSPEERQLGLMHRDSLAPGSGMIFVFEPARSVSFWMKNTLIPLDMAFVGVDGRVLNIAEADPEPGVPDAQLASYTSSGSAKWVIEINQGLCSDYGIVPGVAVTVLFPE